MNDLNSLIAMARDMEISGNLPVSLSTTRWAIAEIERLRSYEQELADAASLLQSALPIGEVKAMGLREVAAGCRQLVSEVGRLRVDNEKLAKHVGEWIEHFPEAGEVKHGSMQVDNGIRESGSGIA